MLCFLSPNALKSGSHKCKAGYHTLLKAELSDLGGAYKTVRNCPTALTLPEATDRNFVISQLQDRLVYFGESPPPQVF